jgi:hypothetical protein
MNSSAGPDDSWLSLSQNLESAFPSATRYVTGGLDINMELSQARWNGKSHDLTARQASALKALLNADGDWVSLSGLSITKPSAVMGRLPAEIRALIESKSGKGYRLKAHAFGSRFKFTLVVDDSKGTSSSPST